MKEERWEIGDRVQVLPWDEWLDILSPYYHGGDLLRKWAGKVATITGIEDGNYRIDIDVNDSIRWDYEDFKKAEEDITDKVLEVLRG